MADESNDPSRPSFSEFWKKSKEALGGKKLRFVDSTPGQGAGSGSSGEWLQLSISWSSRGPSDWPIALSGFVSGVEFSYTGQWRLGG